MPRPSRYHIKHGLYPKTDGNTDFEKTVLRYFGFPEDYLPGADEAKNMVETYMEEEHKDGKDDTRRGTGAGAERTSQKDG